MIGKGARLFNSRLKKSKLKASTPIKTESSSLGAGDPSPPPPPQNESLIRRYLFVWPQLLIVNFIIGGYVLMRTALEDPVTSEPERRDGSTRSTSTSTTPAAAISEKAVTPLPVESIQRASIPEDQKRELL